MAVLVGVLNSEVEMSLPAYRVGKDGDDVGAGVSAYEPGAVGAGRDMDAGLSGAPEPQTAGSLWV